LPDLPSFPTRRSSDLVWYRAEPGGAFRALSASQQQQWLAVLADVGPWAEPAYANPTCTDAGATYLIASLPNRPFLLRAANCATRSEEHTSELQSRSDL